MAMEKLIIKIKIPPGGSELRFECPTCKKSFSSGKGLGGHKRVHLRNTAGNNQHRTRLASELQIVPYPQTNATGPGKKQTQGSSLELQIVAHPKNSTTNDVHLCPVCQQAWPSLKSVHGHMRKHRNRNWRGMIPPNPQAAIKNSGPLLLEGNSLTGEGEKLALVVATDVQTLAWSERRRRHGKAPMEMIPETDKYSLCEAYDLMTLATWESSRKVGFEPKKKRKLKQEISEPIVVSGGNSTKENTSLFIRSLKRFVCDICNKQFKTYQALGGHRSHHFLNIDGDDKFVGANQNPTGGAIGEEMQQLLPPVSEVRSDPEGEKEKENNNQSRLFMFDLNELPPPEELE